MNARRILGGNIRYELIAFLLAVAFWVWVTGQANNLSILGNQSLKLALEVRNLPANLIVLSDLPLIEVELKGDNPELSVSDLRAYVDLKDAVAGPDPASYEVTVKFPEGVNIKSTNPRSVHLIVDEFSNKRVSVNVELSGTPAKGFKAGTPVITPSEVNVHGPSTVLAHLTQATVEVNLNDLDTMVWRHEPIIFKNFEGFNLFAPDPSQSYLTSSPERAEVLVPIYEEDLASKKVPITVQTTGDLPDGLELRGKIDIKPESIEVFGSEEALQGITSVRVGSISLNELTASRQFTFNMVNVQLPEGVQASSDLTFNVLVGVQAREKQQNVEAVPVEIRNRSEAYTYSAINPVKVTVGGYPEVLQNVQASSITLWIDAAMLVEGSQTVEVFWSLPAGVTLVQPPRVSVTVTPVVPPADSQTPPGDDGEPPEVTPPDDDVPADTSTTPANKVPGSGEDGAAEQAGSMAT